MPVIPVVHFNSYFISPGKIIVIYLPVGRIIIFNFLDNVHNAAEDVYLLLCK